MHVSKKLVLFALSVCTALSLSGCGGSSKPIGIAITSSSSTVDGTNSVTLTAAVTNDKNSAGVSWAITSGGGALSNQTTTSATYTAPAATSSSQTITVTATSVAKSTQTGTVTITVPAAPAVTTTSASLTGAVGSAFSIKLAASGGIPPFTWALGSGTTLPTCLTLKSDGTLTTANGLAPNASCAGSYTNLTFKATDSGTPNPLSVTSAPLTVTIAAPSLAFSPTLPAGAVGTAYAGSVAATGVVGASTYTIAGGALPADLSLNASTGAITGTPKSSDAGTFTFTVNVVDAYGDTATSGSLSITIAAAAAITFTGSVPSAGTYGVAFTGSAAATGGAGALTYSISAGALPPDLSLSASTGAISGNPNKAADVGVFNFTVQAADAFGDSATQAYTLTVSYPAMSITTSALPTGYVNGAYTQTTLAATGGTGLATNYQWQVSGGALPGGLTLSTAGVISGTVANTTTTGTYNFTAKVTDSVAGISGTANLSIAVDAGVSITTSSLPTGYVGSVYTSTTLQASGGTGAGYQWMVTGGTNLPSGLTLSPAGVLGGTPANTGTTSVTFQVTDSVGNSATASLSVTIDAGVSVTAPALATGYPGTAYTSSAFTASGGTGAGYTWSWAPASGSSLPSGLSINSSTGVVAGTPTNAGTSSATSSVVVTATDSVGNKGSATVSITIEATLTVTTPANLPAGTAGVSYSQSLAASGGSGTGYTWTTDTAGTTSLAGVGLALATNGTVAGTTPTLGTATFTATVKDSEGHAGSASIAVDINNQLKINQTTLPAGDQGSAYSQTLTASGGSGSSYTFTATSSNLASFGLTLASSGTISGTPTAAGDATFTANVKDSANTTATQALTIHIYGALSLPSPNPSSLPGGYVGIAYTGSVGGSGGSGNLSMAVTTALSPANGTLATGVSGATVNVTGTPANATTESFGVTLTDTTTSNAISQNYTIAVTTPTAPSLPPSSTTVPGSATNGQAYTASIAATGGVGPTYTWTVNSTPVSGSLALGGSGLSSQFSVSNSGSSTLSITGSPTSTGTVNFTAQVKDNTTGLTSSTQSYSIQVNSAGSTVSGQIFLNSNCGGSSGNQPIFTVSINTTPTATTTTTDSNGNFMFTGIPDGTYTITPSIQGASSSVFYPAAYTGVALSSSTNNNVTGENFNAVVGYTVSGTVTYGGSQTGQTYLVLNNNSCGGSGRLGASISEAALTSGGAFSIRGVPPGSYSLQAWMDPLGQAAQNKIDPMGSTAITVANANVTTAAVTMTNPTFATPSSNPGLKALPDAGGALIFYQASSVQDSNGNSVEDANQYTVQWSTSPTLTGAGGSFATVSGSKTFSAIGTNGATLWIMNNTTISGSPFNTGTTYYFQAQSANTLAGTASPAGWSTYTDGSGNPKGVTIGAALCSSSCTAVSGAVTIPSGVTVAGGAPLYVGFYQQSSSGKGPSAIYAVEISNPVAGANNYSITIPSGSGYTMFGILDQNIDGRIDAGDVTNVHDNNSSGVTISGSTMSGQNLTLPDVNSTAAVSTQYQSNVYSGSTTPSTSYQININLREANKLPVAVTLTSGPNLMNPVDMGICTYCGSPQFDYSATIPGGSPSVNDTYDFTVTYSDGSQDTGSTVNGKVTAWDSANGGSSVVGAANLPTNLSPTGTASTSTTPTFTWTFPANPSDFNYSFYISLNNCSGSCNNIWQIPGNNSNSNGFTYAESSGGSGTTGTLTWGVDPIPGDNSSPTGSLTLGDSYNWTIQVQDSNGNQAQAQTWYQP